MPPIKETNMKIILMLLLLSSVAFASPTGTVWLADNQLLTVRNGCGSMTVADRTSALQERANNLISVGKSVDGIMVVKSGADFNIVISTPKGQTLFTTVTLEDGKSNNTTNKALAFIWAKRIASILPTVTSKPKGIKNWL